MREIVCRKSAREQTFVGYVLNAYN
jgi:hypothetical protein